MGRSKPPCFEQRKFSTVLEPCTSNSDEERPSSASILLYVFSSHLHYPQSHGHKATAPRRVHLNGTGPVDGGDGVTPGGLAVQVWS